jgi:hypothetical protein
MTTPPEHASDTTTAVVVLDMAALRIALDRPTASVAVLNGVEPVAVFPLASFDLAGFDAGFTSRPDGGPDETPRREFVFQVLDRTLKTGRLTRVDAQGAPGRLGVALYNPYTAEVAVGAVPTTRAFSRGAPLPLPAGGLVCTVGSQTLVLPDGTELVEQERTFAQMTRVFAAHVA